MNETWSTDDEQEEGWTDDRFAPFGSGQICEEIGLAGKRICPFRERCYAPDNFGFGDGNGHCACVALYGWEGKHCENMTTQTALQVTFFTLAAILSTCNLFFYWWTIFRVAQVNAKTKSPIFEMNPATATLLLGAFASVFMTIDMTMHVITGLVVDFGWQYQLLLGPKVTGMTTATLIPTLLNVSTLWLDLALKSMSSGQSRSKRANTKHKIQMGVWSISAFFSIVVVVCLSTNRTGMATAVLVLVLMCIMLTYRIGSGKLVSMLTKGKKNANTGSKEGCCSKPDNGVTDFNALQIIQTATLISRGCAFTLSCAVAYTVSTMAMQRTMPLNPIEVIGAAGIFIGCNISLLAILLYIRFGMRKKLGIDYKVAPNQKLVTVLSTQTSIDSSGDRRDSGSFSPSNGNLQSVPEV